MNTARSLPCETLPSSMETPKCTDRRKSKPGMQFISEEKEGMATNLIDPVEKQVVRPLELSERLVKDLVQVFKLLSDETRLRILLYLSRAEELHVTALCDLLGQSQPAVSHHLALLRVAGLIEPRREGKHNFYSIRSEHFHNLMEQLFGGLPEDERQIRFEDFVLTYNAQGGLS